mmetsp:Transcript_32119/g.70319  ORF Transcript_32119/g.70319 Transcript_32119/m.70319 type:complete len:194 (-) Transcript_32119:74-655(-)
MSRSMGGGEGGETDEEESLLPQKASAAQVGSFSSSEPQASSRPSWSAIALGILTLTLSATIWSLPAPTFMSKVNLARQSWHLSEVLQEAPTLRKELVAKQNEIEDIAARAAQARAKSEELQKQVDVSEAKAAQIRRQLDDVRMETGKLRGEDTGLRKRMESEISEQKQLEDKLKKLKELELPLLNEIPDGDAL